MTTSPNSPRLLKGGIVLLDPQTSRVLRVIALQYNPDTLSRTLQVHPIGDSGDRLKALRLKGPPNETIKLDAEIDATDQIEFPDLNRTATEFGIFPRPAALQTAVYPASARLQANNGQAGVLAADFRFLETVRAET